MVKQLLKSKLVWASVGVSLVMAMLMAFSYLGAFLDPADNTHNLPLVVVNADQGLKVGQQNLNYGQQLLDKLSGPQASDAIQWNILSSRDEALNGLKQDKYYAAVIIPADYTAHLAALSSQSITTPAQIEILTNPAAGTYAGSLSQTAAQTVVTTASKAASSQLVSGLDKAGSKISPDAAAVLADPVQAQITPAVPVGAHSARGLSAFYFALLLSLGAFVGSNVINILLAGVVGKKERDQQTVSGQNIFYTKLILFTLMGVAVGLLVTWVAVGWLGMDTPNIWPVLALAVLIAVAVAETSLFFQVAFGAAGITGGVAGLHGAGRTGVRRAVSAPDGAGSVAGS